MTRKPGAWLRSSIRRESLRWARRNWRELGSFVLLLGGGAVVFAFLPMPTFERGFLVGVMMSTLALTLVALPVIGSGQVHRVWGLGGEQATAEELTRRRRRRQGWKLTNGLRMGAEIDHIAVGPGGVLAIETKWVTGTPWAVRNGSLAGPLRDPIVQAKRGARNVQAHLRSRSGGGVEVEVLPVLMIWGPGSPEIRSGTDVIDGVQVFSGRSIDAFHAWLDVERLDADRMFRVQSVIADYETRQIASLGDRS